MTNNNLIPANDLIDEIKLKMMSKYCDNKTKENRARRGAYTDCLCIIKQLLNEK